MAAISLKDKIIDPDDQAFIETFMSDNNQEVYWQGWVMLYTKSNAASKKERILVVTNFRVFTVKHGVLKRSTRQSFPILDMEEMSVGGFNASSSPDSPVNQLHLVFSTNMGSGPSDEANELDIQSEQCVEIAQAILFAFRSITYGLPKEKQPKFELPQSFYQGFVAPEPDTQDGLLAAYCAACDYVGCAAKLPVLDYLMGCFETNDKELNLGDCLGPADKVTVNDIQTVASAMRYTHWFDEIIGVEYPIRDDGLQALALIFGTPGVQSNSLISKLVLVSIRAGKQGFSALAQHIGLGQHNLKYLNISKNNLGDSGVKIVLEAFNAGSTPKVLDTLCMQGCGFTAKGYRDLVTVINGPQWRAGLKVLDVSDNSAGKQGSQALAEYVRDAIALEQLYMMRSDLVVETILEALVANSQLSQHVLQTLNLSGNKLSKAAVPLLAQLLLNSHSLTHLYLVDCALSRQAFIEIMDAAVSNPNPVRFWLELSSNDLGSKGSKELGELFSKKKKIDTVHTLILNNNSMGGDGVIAVCQSLTGTKIHTLSLDSNVKSGMFASNTKEAGEAIAQFMNATPALRELSISGDDNHYLKSAGVPILQALKTNTSLEYLDISRNRLGDEGIKVLADALTVNRTLTSFTAERNRVGIKGLRELHAAILINPVLIDWAIPITDIENIHNSASVKVVRELRSLVYDFEMAMERNLESLKKQEIAASGPPPSVVAASTSSDVAVAAVSADSDSKSNTLALPAAAGTVRRASLHFNDAGRRGSTRPDTHRKGKPHVRTASDLLATFKDKPETDDAGGNDGDVDPDAEEVTQEKEASAVEPEPSPTQS